MHQLEVTIEQLESAIVIHAVGPVDSTTASSLQGPLLHAAEPAQARCSSICRRFRT